MWLLDPVMPAVNGNCDKMSLKYYRNKNRLLVVLSALHKLNRNEKSIFTLQNSCVIVAQLHFRRIELIVVIVN